MSNEWKPEDLFKPRDAGMIYDPKTNTSTYFNADGSKTIIKDPYGAENKALKEQLAAKDAEIESLKASVYGVYEFERQLAAKDDDIENLRQQIIIKDATIRRLQNLKEESK